MPANKCSENHQQVDDRDFQNYRHRRKQSRRGGGDQPTTSRRPTLPSLELHPYEQRQKDQPPFGDQYSVEPNSQEDSDGSGTDPEAFDELVTILQTELRSNDFNERHFVAQLFEARKDVECPICLGIIKKTRTVMGCLHRFCRECIDKSMRLGNNECPACRIHCASRRSLRDDRDFDALINAIYPDAEKYEEEELVFHEEDKTRNEQIQASIVQITEALNKRHKLVKDPDDTSPLRVHRSSRNAYLRRRNNQRTELEAYDGNERENDHYGNENPSPRENCGSEIKHHRRKKRTGVQSSTMSSPAAYPNGGWFDNSMVPIREEIGTPLGTAHNPEMLTWGRGVARSHTRHGVASGSKSNRGTQPSKLIDLESIPNNVDELDVHTPHGSPSDSRSSRATQLSKIINHLESVPNNDNESDVHFTVIPWDKESKPIIEKPFFCCPPGLAVKQLHEYVAHEINLQAEDIQMLLVESADDAGRSTLNSSNPIDTPNLLSQIVDWPIKKLEVLEGQETLEGLSCSSKNGHLMLAYEKKG